MKSMRVYVLAVIGLLMLNDTAWAQRLDIKEVQKTTKAACGATIVFKSNFNELTVKGLQTDLTYKKKTGNFSHEWTQYVDLTNSQEHDTASVANRTFLLQTPYTDDMKLMVPNRGEELQPGLYEYRVRVVDFFPFRVSWEVDFIGLKDYLGMRISAGERLGGYLSFKFGKSKNGVNADECPDNVDYSMKTNSERIRNSLMIGFRYDIIGNSVPVYLFWGAGYGNDGTQRTNGKKKLSERIEYYQDYTCGFESEIGASVVLLDFLSVSLGADALFGHRPVFNVNCTIGLSFSSLW